MWTTTRPESRKLIPEYIGIFYPLKLDCGLGERHPPDFISEDVGSNPVTVSDSP